jgi:signal transduction histidine kinase
MIPGDDMTLPPDDAPAPEVETRVSEAVRAERRRLERDLHDGIQQRLVALALRLGRARAALARDPGTAGALLDDAIDEAWGTQAELRDLARGLRPPVLGEHGLRPALQDLATRAGLPVGLAADPGPWPAGIESCAYFVVAEGLANVGKHAGARRAWVTLRGGAGTLEVEVRDDGRGGAAPAAGSGLSGLADRVAALGGKLDVSSPAGGGTRLRASLPVMP